MSMTKEVLLSIKGLQMSPEDGEDTVEMIAPGEYHFRNDKHFVLYDEVMEGQDEVTKNIVKFQDDYMEITKKGPCSVHMIFEKNKKNVTYYYTPYGSLLIRIRCRLKKRKISFWRGLNTHWRLIANILPIVI